MSDLGGQHWELPGDEIHVWRAGLDVGASLRPRLAAVLSEDERARAARFHFNQDRNRWVAARARLRLLLGRYLDEDPAALQFAAGPQGKPHLVGHKEAALHFSLSHSADLALYAVARGRDVGVDVERLRTDFAPETLAAHAFSPEEIAIIRGAAPEQRHAAFFALWTGKEAAVKAWGDGFSFPITRLTVRPAAPNGWMPIERAPEAPERPDLALYALHPAPGYAAAVAVTGVPPFHIRQRQVEA